MPHRVLDTNKLVRHWRRFKPKGGRTPAGAEGWARKLIEVEETDAIVTPVELELLGGTLSESDRSLMQAYLKPFRIIDEGKILERDWKLARRLIERIPRGVGPRPRGLVDCLIRAIADRLHHDVWTNDEGMPPLGPSDKNHF